jgi:hypothetical protein
MTTFILAASAIGMSFILHEPLLFLYGLGFMLTAAIDG